MSKSANENESQSSHCIHLALHTSTARPVGGVMFVNHYNVYEKKSFNTISNELHLSSFKRLTNIRMECTSNPRVCQLVAV